MASFRTEGFKQSLGGEDDAKSEALRQIEGLERVDTTYPDLFLLVRRPRDVLAAKQDGRMGVIASFEGASMLEGKVDSIDFFRAQMAQAIILSPIWPSLPSTSPSLRRTARGGTIKHCRYGVSALSSQFQSCIR